MPKPTSRTPILILAAVVMMLTVIAAVSRAQTASSSSSSDLDIRSGGHGDVETIVILRHGEKPVAGNGQLTPQGFNRAIALSTVLPEKFGKPDFIFAPDPQQKVKDRGVAFYYVRPLATIEPTAIRFEMPVETPCGADDISVLDRELVKPIYSGDTIFVAWEHGAAQKAAVELLKMLNADSTVVPHWPGNDFDSLYVIKITRTPGQAPVALFSHEQEGLNGQSTRMPVCAIH